MPDVDRLDTENLQEIGRSLGINTSPDLDDLVEQLHESWMRGSVEAQYHFERLEVFRAAHVSEL